MNYDKRDVCNFYKKKFESITNFQFHGKSYRHLFIAAVMQVFEFAGRGSPPFDGESSEIECEFKLVVDDDELSLWNLGLLLVDIFYLASWIRYKMVLIILATISPFHWIWKQNFFCRICTRYFLKIFTPFFKYSLFSFINFVKN